MLRMMAPFRYGTTYRSSLNDRHYAVQDETSVFFDPALPKTANKACVAVDENRLRVIPGDSATTKRKTSVSDLYLQSQQEVPCLRLVTERNRRCWLFHCFLHKTGEKWHSLRSDPTRLKQLLFQFDNARLHAAKPTKEFLARRNIQTLWQPPYSPDLCDRGLFDRWRESSESSFFNLLMKLWHILASAVIHSWRRVRAQGR